MNEKIIQITAGHGPEECTWVVAQVLKTLLNEADKVLLENIVLHREAGNLNGTVRSATILLKGRSVADFVTSWKGTIQWVGQSTFRKMHKRKNWFIGIFELENQQVQQYSENDFVYQSMRSSGPGGQHVNKVNSAIRVRHKPTGLAVVAMDSRSQQQNKKLATERLIEKLHRENLKLVQQCVQEQWNNQTEIERRNPVRVFKSCDFKKENVNKSYKSQRQYSRRDFKKNER